jgi:hypothetical protein
MLKEDSKFITLSQQNVLMDSPTGSSFWLVKSAWWKDNLVHDGFGTLCETLGKSAMNSLSKIVKNDF